MGASMKDRHIWPTHQTHSGKPSTLFPGLQVTVSCLSPSTVLLKECAGLAPRAAHSLELSLQSSYSSGMSKTQSVLLQLGRHFWIDCKNANLHERHSARANASWRLQGSLRSQSDRNTDRHTF